MESHSQERDGGSSGHRSGVGGVILEGEEPAMGPCARVAETTKGGHDRDCDGQPLPPGTPSTALLTGGGAVTPDSAAASVADNDDDNGSTLVGAIFNFTNCIVGAGAIGLGGAIAASGGLISVFSIVAFAILTKRSLDLVIRLSVQQQQQQESGNNHGSSMSYEELGRLAFGTAGSLLIAASKFLYSFGCLVAYVVVVKDNFSPAVLNLLQDAHYCHQNASEYERVNGTSWTEWSSTALHDSVCTVLNNRIATTWLVCIVVMLPLCLLRDMRPLASLSALSIASIVAIVVIIWYLFAVNPDEAIRQADDDNASVYDLWFRITWSHYLQCLGTFVFTFVSQHTAHLAFGSLQPSLQTVASWNQVSLYAVGLSALLSLTIGLGVYASFGRHAKSDIFDIYPQIPLIDVAKLLLSITMVLTFPLPFFTCRELLILHLFPASSSSSRTSLPPPDEGEEEEQPHEDPEVAATAAAAAAETPQPHTPQRKPETSRRQNDGDGKAAENTMLELTEPLIQQQPQPPPQRRGSTGTLSLASDLASNFSTALNWALLPDNAKQLKWPFHAALTIKLWVVVVGLAIAAPNLGDVLDLVGCATGTLIAFVVPALLSLRLEPWSAEAALLLLVGSAVGTVGTFFSCRQILQDLGLLSSSSS